MPSEWIGILHPGEMGISIAAAAQKNGHTVAWVSEARSAKTSERAARFELVDALSLSNLCANCSLIVSVCPPHAAEAVAGNVLDNGYTGMYLDANAIAPERAARMSKLMTKAGVTFIDGAIIGPPAWTLGTTWLYLSGLQADNIASIFSAGPLKTCVLGMDVGKASALKMCYAAYTKGTTALLAAVLVAAGQLGVREALYQQWEYKDHYDPVQLEERVRKSSLKAWRYVGEMEEIADTFRAEELPGEFHFAAATLYRRLASFKDASRTPQLEEVLGALSEARASNNSERGLVKNCKQSLLPRS